jgi:CheY-like chemotaxis protein
MSEEQRISVLVVDDDEDIRQAMGIVLGMNGYTVATVADGAAALAWLRGGFQRPCVILIDLMMPGMNGIELRSRLSSDPAFAGIPVVFITGAGVLADDSAERLNAEILRKPIDLSALLATLARFCHRADDGLVF